MSEILIRSATLELGERKASTDGVARFPCTVSTTTPVKRRLWDGEWDEVLSHDASAVDLARAPLPVIESHDRFKVNVGIVEGLRTDGARLRGMLVLGKSARAQELAADIEAGIVTGLSVGYQITEDKRDEKSRRLTATRWTPFEVSIVSVPADINAGIGRSAVMENAGQQDDSASRMVQQERERVEGIRKAVRAAGLEGALEMRFISEGTSLEAARNAVIEILAARSDALPPSRGNHAPASVTITDDQADKRHRGMVAAILHRFNAVPMIREMVKQGRMQSFDLDGGEFRAMSTLDMAREALESKGVRTRGMDRFRLVQTALSYRGLGGLATTGDLPVMMEQAVNKTLLAAYASTPDTWRKFCGIRQVRDFRDHGLYRNGSFGTLDTVNEHGEYKNKEIPDGEKFTVSVEKRGNIIGITEEMLINDDLGSLGDLAARFGRSAAHTQESQVYSLLGQNTGLGPTQSDSQPFFHSGRGNVNGTGSTLTVAGLDADRVILAAQMDPSGNEYLALTPKVLLVPIGLEGEAKVLNEAQFDHDGSKLGKPNKVRGLFTDVVGTPRLSGTRRYLFADPALAPAIWMVFLEGKGEGPILESREGWRTDGVEWKVKSYFKVNFGDYRGAVTNSGVAA